MWLRIEWSISGYDVGRMKEKDDVYCFKKAYHSSLRLMCHMR